MDSKPSFTGRKRQHQTPWSVRAGEILSRVFITVGGIGTILAVATVCVFLVWVAVPLFLPAQISAPQTFPSPWKEERPLRTGIDEYQMIGWSLFKDGTLCVYNLDDGQLLHRGRPEKLYPDSALAACSSPSREADLALGFADGTVQLGRIGFAPRLLDSGEITPDLRDLKVEGVAPFQDGLVRRRPDGTYRLQKLKVTFEEPIKPTNPSPVVLIDQSIRPTGTVVSFLTADGKLRTNAVSKREDLIADKIFLELSGGELNIPARQGKGPPDYVMLAGVGDNVFLVWADGHVLRINTRNLEEPKVAEELNLLADVVGGHFSPNSPVPTGQKLTALLFQIGKATLLVGDSSGRVRAWFLVHDENSSSADGMTLVAAHEFPGTGAAVTSLATSSRTRLMAAGYADGSAHLYYVSSEKFLGEVLTRTNVPVSTLALAPKENGLFAQGASGCWYWEFDPRHPEITLKSLFLPVWYEGNEKPTHTWQSSGGDDAVEPKFGLWPLVFGTIKATFYSLLLGVPLALLAAVYTSEFLSPRTRAVIKPTIEVMAGLPSVVLGFLAALVLAPFVAKVLPAVLAGFLTIPGAFLLGAYGWQLMPEKLALRLGRSRFLFACLVLPLGMAGAAWLGPLLERLLFRGDLRGWLNGQIETSAPGWFLLLIPLAALLIVFLMGQVVNPWFRRQVAGRNRFQTVLADLGKFLAAAVITLALAAMLAVTLDGLGFDLRGSIVGTYQQRNALVVGFMMGFAIIPIIYTIAEDALSVVPEHLRSASLGCGATPWQTAVRIIIPTAMSGLFSAVMVGLGRAVGETMVVLMATGNTPILEWNIFNGFRTLSATIAVELPEAPRNSTHFRTLFLAALTLFLMTFLLNTVAEVVRQRFRKRAYQL